MKQNKLDRQDFRIINASRNTMESTGQEILILELSEVDYNNISSEERVYTFEMTGKEFIFDFASFYEKAKNTFANEEIFTINLSEFQPLWRDKLMHFHKSVRL